MAPLITCDLARRRSLLTAALGFVRLNILPDLSGPDTWRLAKERHRLRATPTHHTAASIRRRRYASSNALADRAERSVSKESWNRKSSAQQQHSTRLEDALARWARLA